MDRLGIRTLTHRLVATAAASMIAAVFLVAVNPFPGSVLGQTTPAQGTTVEPGGQVVLGPQVTVVNQGTQPVNITVEGNTFTIVGAPGVSIIVTGATCTGQTTNVVVCTVTPNTQLSIVTSVAGVTRQPQVAPASAQGGSAPVVLSAPIQQGNLAPTTLPRTGFGAEDEGGLSGSGAGALALMALAAATGGAALAVRLRRWQR